MKGSKQEISPGVWRFRVYAGRRPNGTPIQVTKTIRAPERKPGAGSRLADSELAKLVVRVSSGKVTATGSETVAGLLDQWLDHREGALSPTTMRENRRTVEKVLKPELGRIRLSKVTARHLDELYLKLSARRLKPSAVRRIHAVIASALHQAERWGMVEFSVARRAQPPPMHAGQVVAPSPEQVRAVVEAAERVEPALAVLLLLAALTGARRGELCALRWSDVNWTSKTLDIARSVYETKGGGWAEKSTKTHAVRRIGLDDFALAVLKRHRASVDTLADDLELSVPSDAFIFSRSPSGSEPYRPDFVSKFIHRIAAASGINTHLHALRHFSATELIAGGYDVRTVAGRLGHADPGVTLRVYSHALPQRDREAAAALGRTLSLTRSS